MPEAAWSCVCALGAQNRRQRLSLLSVAQMSALVFSEVLFSTSLITHRRIYMVSLYSYSVRSCT